MVEGARVMLMVDGEARAKGPHSKNKKFSSLYHSQTAVG